MTANPLFKIVSMVVAITGVVLWGCASTSPTSFYMLRPTAYVDPQEAHARSENDLRILIGPVTVPDYLERPQIVTRTENNELLINEFHQWAEPLESNIGRVLGENLSALLATERIVQFPGRRTSQTDFQVVVEVIRFDANEAGETVLTARWRVVTREGEEAVPQRRSSYAGTAGELTYDALAATMSDIIGELSSDIALAIKSAK